MPKPAIPTSNIPEANPSDVASIDAIVTAAYDVISGPADKKRDWDRERSLFLPGARLIPTAVEAGRNDVDLAPQMLDIEGYIARVDRSLRKGDSTKKKSRGGSNNLARFHTFGAHTNRVTI